VCAKKKNCAWKFGVEKEKEKRSIYEHARVSVGFQAFWA
jgi:hypothetical protein